LFRKAGSTRLAFPEIPKLEPAECTVVQGSPYERQHPAQGIFVHPVNAVDRLQFRKRPGAALRTFTIKADSAQQTTANMDLVVATPASKSGVEENLLEETASNPYSFSPAGGAIGHLNLSAVLKQQGTQTVTNLTEC